ncbi:MAG: hypothetical protein HC880_10095 [Bacteroidia bacterium]|nr:hypothetical protein [Bacteroidia bacterium]
MPPGGFGFYAFVTYLFATMEGIRHIPILAVMSGAVTLMWVLITVIHLYWRISAHSVGICGTLGMFFGISLRFSDEGLFYPILVGIVLAGALMSARLYLNLHNLAQVSAGGLLGFSIGLVAILFFL